MKKNIFALAALLIALATMFTACSSDDNIISEQQPEQGVKTYTMTVQASKGDGVTTRALAIDNSGAKNVLNATWAAGERVTVYNVTKSAALGGYLEAQTSGTNTTLKGELTGTIEAGDQLKLAFLGPNYDGQNGTLDYIAANCDYAEATITVDAIDGSNITPAAAANFANQQAIVKFTLTDGTTPLNASSLTIAAASNRLVKGQVHDIPDTYHSGYTVTAGTGGFSDSESHSKLLDGNTETKWCQNGGTYNITFNTASPVQVDGYSLTTANDTEENSGRNPKNWTLKGKLNEGDAWTTIAQVTNDNIMPAANFTAVNFVADNPGSYQYFYFEVTATRGADVFQLSEMKLWKGTDAVTTAYAPLTVTPASATNELTVALCNASGAADTYTLTATVGGDTYTYEKAGVTFQNGKYYEITVKMTKVVAAKTVTLTPSQIGDLWGDWNESKTVDGITIAVSGEGWSFTTTGLNRLNGNESGSITFSSSVGNIKKIEINHTGMSDWNEAGSGWGMDGIYEAMSGGTFTWAGTPASSVTLTGEGVIYDITEIVFTLE